MTKLKILDQAPAGWHALDVARAGRGPKWDLVSLMVDVPFRELKHCQSKIAFLYVHPKKYRPTKGRVAREAWVRIPGKNRNKDAAWDALQDMLKTRQ